MERLGDVIDTQSEGGEDDIDNFLFHLFQASYLQNVDFTFNDGATCSQVSFLHASGSFARIVGRSGGGKAL